MARACKKVGKDEFANLNRRLVSLTIGLVALTLVVALAALLSPRTQAAQPVYLCVNPIGYLSDESKLALALTNQNLNGQTFNLVSASTGSVVFSNPITTDRGAYGQLESLRSGFFPIGLYCADALPYSNKATEEFPDIAAAGFNLVQSYQFENPSALDATHCEGEVIDNEQRKIDRGLQPSRAASGRWPDRKHLPSGSCS